jgi:hypothetical protein
LIELAGARPGAPRRKHRAIFSTESRIRLLAESDASTREAGSLPEMERS